jgi:hypothetical protein
MIKKQVSANSPEGSGTTLEKKTPKSFLSTKIVVPLHPKN